MRRRWARAGIGIVAAVVCAGTPVLGQPSRGLTSLPTTSVVGIVGDSLHGGPLAGAVVMLDGLPREAVTDSIGRFRIDSVAAGLYRVGIFHPILDSLGTSLASQPVRFRPGRPLLISIATPSGRTIRRAICPGWRRHTPRYEHADSGVALLVGRVVDPESEAPVGDAAVTLSWIETAFKGASTTLTPYERSTTTDATGEFRFCAIPSGLNGVLRASINSETAPSAPDVPRAVEREIDLENRIVTMATIHLPAGDTLSATNPPGRAELTGVVDRPDGSPLVGAIAVVDGTSDSVVTGGDGTFTIHDLPVGTHMVRVRSVGFEPVSDVVELSSHSPQHVNIALTTPARVPNSVLVAAHRLQAGYARVGFDRRQLDGAGQFLTADDIADKHAQFFSLLLAGTIAVQSEGLGPAGGALTSRQATGSCIAYVLDGNRFDPSAGTDLDALYRPDEIAGIEIYGSAVVPIEFRAVVVAPPKGPMSVTAPSDNRPGASGAPQPRTGTPVPSQIRASAVVPSEDQGTILADPRASGSSKLDANACTTVVVWTKSYLRVPTR